MVREEDFIVTPWEVEGRIDYSKLVERFGTQFITEELINRLRKHVSYLHPMLRRQIFYSHRDVDWILNLYEKGEAFYFYTGRGPSGHTHLGHLMPWIFTRYLQEHFKARLYFQLTDDEKFLFDDALQLQDTSRYAYENALDLIALGFEPESTRIFLDTEYIHTLYKIAIKVAKRINFSTTKAVFGFTNSNNIGSIFYTSIQAAPCFLETELTGRNVACLIPCGIDQDPHFRVCRDVAPLLGYYKPALIHNKLFPSLGGPETKMSASLPETCIFTTDVPEVARKKIKNAFTGGAVSVKEQKEKGGSPDICSVYQYYFILFEERDEKLEELERKCRSGEILCGECKKELVVRVEKFLKEHQAKREKARDRVERYMLRD